MVTVFLAVTSIMSIIVAIMIVLVGIIISFHNYQ